MSVLTEPVASQDKIGKKVTLYRNITTGEVSEDAAVEKKVAQILLVGSIFVFFMMQLFMLPFLLNLF